MCGRFALFTSPESLADWFAVPDVPRPLPPRYNIAPTQPVLAVRYGAQQPEFALFRWGLIPSWARELQIGARLINARAETAVEKPAFRAAFKRRRCLIPASGFYEWQQVNGRKQPYFIHPSAAQLFAFAGLWEVWHGSDGSELQSCTILTTPPNELMQPIHDRMPAILARAEFTTWLDPALPTEEAQRLLRPFPATSMAAYPVSTSVNKPSYDAPDCILPLA